MSAYNNKNELVSPFLKRTVRCSVCKVLGEHRLFRVHLFAPKEVETDQHVLSYKWLSENTWQVHPPYFTLYYCMSCFFTDLIDDYCNPTNCKAGAWVIKSFGRFSGDSNQIVELMGTNIDYEIIDYNTAVTLHGLAAYIQALAPEDVRDNFKLGRLFLRLAWLYRERDAELDLPDGPRVCADRPFGSFRSLAAFMVEVRKLWPEAPVTEKEALALAARHFEAAISADARFDSPKEYGAGVKLLLEVLNRCGDLDRAYETVRGIYGNAMDLRKKNRDIIMDKDSSERLRKKAEADEKSINQLAGDAAEFRDNLLNTMIDRDLPQIRAFVQEHSGLPPKILLAKLVQAGFRIDVLRRVAGRVGLVIE